MINKDYSEAKKLFLGHVGVHYFMALNGTLEKYKQFEVPEELELEWLQEALDKMKITIRDIKNQKSFRNAFSDYRNMAYQIVYRSGNKEELYFMKKLFEEKSPDMDSFTLDNCAAYDIFSMLKLEDDMMKRREIICDILKILRDALNKEIIISDDYKEDRIVSAITKDEAADRLQNTIEMYEKELYGN